MPTCGGFFDVARLRKRLGQLDAEMARETFWTNRDQAQKLIDEAGSLRRKIDPLLAAEGELEDFRVMIELAEGEPGAEQLKHLRELDREIIVPESTGAQSDEPVNEGVFSVLVSDAPPPQD